MTATTVPSEIADAHRRFQELVAEVRPELHRYCARMTGSIIDGEDVVQETLAKAFYALATAESLPPLRPWLFRVAHNAAIDFTRRHDRARVDLVPEAPEGAAATDGAVASVADDLMDKEAVRAALAVFVTLPPLQRSAVILKDVLDCTGAEIAEMLGTTVLAVKAALVRGRERLRAELDRRTPDGESSRIDEANDIEPEARAALERYVALFNAGDWDGIRAVLAEEVELDLVSRSSRKGKAVGFYFSQYEKSPDVRVALGKLDGRTVLFAYAPKSSVEPTYLIEVAHAEGRVAFIRDYRYVSYVARELALADVR